MSEARKGLAPKTTSERVAALRAARGGTKLGSFFLVYGNGPDELIADYTFNPFCEAMAKRACPGMF